MKLQSKIATSLGLMLLLACVSFAQHVKNRLRPQCKLWPIQDLHLGKRSRRKTGSWSTASRVQ